MYRQIENSEAFARFDYYSSQSARVRHRMLKQKLAVSTEDFVEFRVAAPRNKGGKLSPAKQELAINQTLSILQHAKGGPLQIGIGHVTAVLPTKVVYDANTEPGSSGAPVFNMNWELVGIHQCGNLRNNS